MPRQYAMTDADFMGFLRDYHTRHGYMPSVRDIIRSTSYTTTSGVARRLHALRDAGLLTFEDGKARTIVLRGSQ